MDFRELINEEDVNLPEAKPLEMLVMGLNSLFKNGELPNKMKGEQYVKKAKNRLKSSESKNEVTMKKAAANYFKKNYKKEMGDEQDQLKNFMQDLNNYTTRNVYEKAYEKLLNKISKGKSGQGRKKFKEFWDTLFENFVSNWPIANVTTHEDFNKNVAQHDDFENWKEYQEAFIYNRLYFIFIAYKFVSSIDQTRAIPNIEQAVKYAQIRKIEKIKPSDNASNKEFGTATNVQNIINQALKEIPEIMGESYIEQVDILDEKKNKRKGGKGNRGGKRKQKGNMKPGQDVQAQDAQDQNVQAQNVQDQNVQGQNVQGQNVKAQDVQGQNVQGQEKTPILDKKPLNNFNNFLKKVKQSKSFTPEKFNTFAKPNELNLVDQMATFLSNNPDLVADLPYTKKALDYMVWSKTSGPGGDPKWADRFAARHPKLAMGGKAVKGAGKAAGWLASRLVSVR